VSQKVLTMMTIGCCVRSAADGWSADDSSLVVMNKSIGMTPSLQEFYCFDCPLKAMAAGWKLLGPPTIDNVYGDDVCYRWWFTKD
jgi:hypothetical protein